MVIGAPFHNYLEDPTGCAYVYKNNSGTWVQHQKLVPSDATLNDYIGAAVAIDGNYLVIGCNNNGSKDSLEQLFYNPSGTKGTGKAYIYKLEGNTWEEKDKIFSSTGFNGDGFGYCLDISGNRIAVGGEVSEDDKVYIFEKGVGEDWYETYQINIGYADRRSVSISGEFLLVGRPMQYNTPWPGYADMYEYNGLDWIHSGALDHNVCDEGWFGYSVSVQGNQAIVGAPNDDDNGENSGSIFSYLRDESGNWNFVNKITPSNGNDEYCYGFSCELGNYHAIVGQPQQVTDYEGSAYLYPNFIIPCERNIHEVAFTPDPGEYPEITAGTITLGGDPPNQVVFQNQVIQKYIGGDIRLLPGFHAQYGSDFIATGINCSSTSSKTDDHSNHELKYFDFEIEATNSFDNNGNQAATISVFPIPTQDILYIKSVNYPITKLELIDLHGRVIKVGDNLQSNNEKLFLGGINNGIYFLKVKTSMKEELFKIIH
ncbi:MAG: T9SS type A sorting domain-containing protein [Bacteroidales bacterium]|nr:T9SS type A sorting domain-containing protein [Bacteroidales bacterium]